MPLPYPPSYKDKPVKHQWRSSTSRLVGRPRRVVFILCILICSMTLWRWRAGPRPRYDYSLLRGEDEEDLFLYKDFSVPDLARSLLAASNDASVHPIQNVFFMLNGLGPADTNLVDLGCRMSRARQGVFVSFIILGGGTTTLSDFRRVNQFDEEHCPAHFHDVRKTIDTVRYAETAAYMSYAVHALNILVEQHNPRAIIYTHSAAKPKPNWFLAAHDRHKFSTTQIALPQASVADLSWLSTLSGSSLNAWNKPRIDIIVSASQATGSLARLLRSLANARYPHNHFPNLLIQFNDSSSISAREEVRKFSFTWPDARLQIRHSNGPVMEAWYPPGEDAFLLLLDEQTEVSPFFYHYLKSMALRYRYDEGFRAGAYRDNVLGISLTSSLGVGIGTASTMPSLTTKLDSLPLLLFPNHCVQFRERPATSLQGYLDAARLVVIQPPRLVRPDGTFALARHHPVQEPVELSLDDTTERQSVALVTDSSWWQEVGHDEGHLPVLRNMELLDAQGRSVPLIEYFNA